MLAQGARLHHKNGLFGSATLVIIQVTKTEPLKTGFTLIFLVLLTFWMCADEAHIWSWFFVRCRFHLCSRRRSNNNRRGLMWRINISDCRSGRCCLLARSSSGRRRRVVFSLRGTWCGSLSIRISDRRSSSFLLRRGGIGVFIHTPQAPKTKLYARWYRFAMLQQDKKCH